jgi:hypothetical protein
MTFAQFTRQFFLYLKMIILIPLVGVIGDDLPVVLDLLVCGLISDD